MVHHGQPKAVLLAKGCSGFVSQRGRVSGRHFSLDLTNANTGHSMNGVPMCESEFCQKKIQYEITIVSTFQVALLTCTPSRCVSQGQSLGKGHAPGRWKLQRGGRLGDTFSTSNGHQNVSCELCKKVLLPVPKVSFHGSWTQCALGPQGR